MRSTLAPVQEIPSAETHSDVKPKPRKIITDLINELDASAGIPTALETLVKHLHRLAIWPFEGRMAALEMMQDATASHESFLRLCDETPRPRMETVLDDETLRKKLEEWEVAGEEE